MKKILLFLAPAVAMLMSACGSGEVKVIKVPELEAAQVSLVGELDSLLAPRSMAASDGRLVIYEEKAEHPFIVYGLPFDGRFFRALTLGRGPGEIIRPFQRLIPASDGFEVLDMGDGAMKSFAFGDDELIPGKVVDIPFKITPAGSFLPLGDGFIYDAFLYRDFSKEWAGYDYHFVDPATGEITLMCPTPDWKDNVDDNSNVVLRTSTPAVRRDGTMFAVFYAFHNRVFIFDSEGNVLKEFALPLEGVQDKFDSPVYYRRVVASDDEWIVAQFGTSEYHFFDWNGRLHKRISLDRPMSLPAFDFESGVLYGLDQGDDIPKLYSVHVRL